MQCRILLVDDEILKLMTLRDALVEKGHMVETCATGEAAMEKFKISRFDIVILDLKLPDISGLELLEHFREMEPDVAVIMMTAYGTISTAVEAMRLGAHDFATKPFLNDELILKIDHILSYRELRSKASYLERELLSQRGLENLVGNSPPMERVFELIRIVAPTDSTVLLCGESGTGKQVTAHAIHKLSPFNEGPFINISCGALAPNLLESELFGHEKGAFTGAANRKIGRFELAEGGIIFLDDIDDVDISLQVKLLRVLQDRDFERVGGTKTISVNARVIAATKKDLYQCVEMGTFRRDLYYRLNVFPITLPPLHERLEDIPALTDNFLSKKRGKNARKVTRVTNEALELLIQHSWPGNIRELENVIERALIICPDNTLDRDSLSFFRPTFDIKQETDIGNLLDSKTLSHREIMARFEKEVISAALRKTAGNKAHAASLLKIPRSTLVDRIHKLGLE